jgi:hypothetical protein
LRLPATRTISATKLAIPTSRTVTPDLATACLAVYPLPASNVEDEQWDRRGVCLSRATAYSNAVRKLGQTAYDAAQKISCECCPANYHGTLEFNLRPAGGTISGHSVVTWTQFKSENDVRQYLPSGSITADISMPNCDSIQAVIPIHTSPPSLPNETLTVYTAASASLPRRYQFTIAGDGDLALNCGTPRRPTTLPGSSVFVAIGVCNGDDTRSFVDEGTLTDGPYSCAAFGLESASWRFEWPQ